MGLEKLPQTSELAALVAECEIITDIGYTSESWTSFKSALTSARSLLLSGVYTQAQLDNAASKLRSAKFGLTLAPVAPPVDPIGPGTYLPTDFESFFGSEKAETYLNILDGFTLEHLSPAVDGIEDNLGESRKFGIFVFVAMLVIYLTKCIIVANFSYVYADYKMHDWHDLMNIRNGTDGVLFLIDEIHSEYSSKAWKDFPEELLSEISQQRKQRIKICATSQIYGRMVKQLREQCFSVVQCSTVGGRWTFNKEYDAKDYEIWCESLSKKKLRPFNRVSFIQSDDLRNCYDTYEKIERLAKMEFIDRHER